MVMLQASLPVPLVLPPLLFRVNVHAPMAVTVPLILALPPHVVVFPLVIAAEGLSFTVIVTLTHDDEPHGDDS